ncbi:MAG TPA: nicotinate-nucleotide--dimethylbenzimidazole phosphoribosyltransferase [Bryobacteraceae bacterium]|jgi:nicotinate-nucleotide--dimethylbenzimidazole phosphoribosyltransferase|nr:nicotinate-nucleotide--dimethylbenzimidazole phosphoribosyltransferase [Bryobacteraceae bacterium]
MNLLHSTIEAVRPVDPQWIAAAERHQLALTKPPGSLGRLEEIANRCAAIRESLAPTAARPRIVIFAADHGVCAEGVSAYPQEVTAQMVANYLRGGAAINALARAGDIELKVVDIGVAAAIGALDGLIGRRVSAGTRNFCVGPAMTEAEMHAALETGIQLAAEAAGEGCDLLGFGEMGIGNTTAASAIAAALTSLPVEKVVGRGTGVDDEGIARKRRAIERGLTLHAPLLRSPLGILQCVGGLEIAAMCGFCLGAAAQRLPVVMDGFIATAAAALALRLCPAAAGYLFAAHRSVEPGHASLLASIGQEPLLDLGMRLGEGTGAALAMGIVQAAVAAFTQMATFAGAGVTNR